jgi:hypothetical protein
LVAVVADGPGTLDRSRRLKRASNRARLIRSAGAGAAPSAVLAGAGGVRCAGPFAGGCGSSARCPRDARCGRPARALAARAYTPASACGCRISRRRWRYPQRGWPPRRRPLGRRPNQPGRHPGRWTDRQRAAIVEDLRDSQAWNRRFVPRRAASRPAQRSGLRVSTRHTFDRHGAGSRVMPFICSWRRGPRTTGPPGARQHDGEGECVELLTKFSLAAPTLPATKVQSLGDEAATAIAL